MKGDRCSERGKCGYGTGSRSAVSSAAGKKVSMAVVHIV